MDRQEHMLTIAMEECNEIAHRIAKVLRFGMLQVQQDADDKPEQNPERLTNQQRVEDEFAQLVETLQMAGFNTSVVGVRALSVRAQKHDNIERYLERSARCGTLAPQAAQE